MNQDIIDFYQILRKDDAIIAELSALETADEILDTAVIRGGMLGFHFTKEEASAASRGMDAFRANLANDDELSDFELDLIAAGSPLPCDDT